MTTPATPVQDPAAFPPAAPTAPTPPNQEFVPVPVSQRYKVLNMTDQEMKRHKRAVETNMRTRSRSTRPFQQINLPRGMEIWAIPGMTETHYEQEIEGIIIDIRPPRAYFPKQYVAGGPKEPPACSSIDGITGYGDNGTGQTGAHACLSCRQNVYGTGQNGRGRACREHRTVYIITPGQAWPTIIQVPVTSFRNLENYTDRLTQNGIPYDTVVTRFRLRKVDEENTVMVFAMGDVLSDEEDEKVQTLAKPIIQSIEEDAQRRVQAALDTNALDMDGILVEATEQNALPAPETGSGNSSAAADEEFDRFAAANIGGAAPDAAGSWPPPAGFPPAQENDPAFYPSPVGAGVESRPAAAPPPAPPTTGVMGLDPAFDV